MEGAASESVWKEGYRRASLRARRKFGSRRLVAKFLFFQSVSSVSKIQKKAPPGKVARLWKNGKSGTGKKCEISPKLSDVSPIFLLFPIKFTHFFLTFPKVFFFLAISHNSPFPPISSYFPSFSLISPIFPCPCGSSAGDVPGPRGRHAQAIYCPCGHCHADAGALWSPPPGAGLRLKEIGALPGSQGTRSPHFFTVCGTEGCSTRRALSRALISTEASDRCGAACRTMPLTERHSRPTGGPRLHLQHVEAPRLGPKDPSCKGLPGSGRSGRGSSPAALTVLHWCPSLQRALCCAPVLRSRVCEHFTHYSSDHRTAVDTSSAKTSSCVPRPRCFTSAVCCDCCLDAAPHPSGLKCPVAPDLQTPPPPPQRKKL